MRTPPRLLATAVALAAAAALSPLAIPGGTAAAAAPARRIQYVDWDTAADFGHGVSRGVSGATGSLKLTRAAYTSGSLEYGDWTSPWTEPGFALTELVASWRASTPGRTRIRVLVRTRAAGGRTSSWDTLALWAYGDRYVRRASGGPQTDDLGRVSYDTWISGSTTGVTGWQLRLQLMRPRGGTATPSIDTVGAMASRLPDVSGVTTSTPRPAPNPALGKVLPVPRYSQMVHEGDYPQYDGGGEAWCSPTSVTMVMAYYDALPPASAYSWVPADHPDRVVDHGARMTYDATLEGTGNWAFSTAYAAARTGGGHVTRLRSLRGAEALIEQGVPVVASVTYPRGELAGSAVASTNGHLLVIVGFTRSGDVVVNDPAASTRSGVRRTYDRGQFEDAWLKRYASGGSIRGSGGLAYVITR